MDSQCQNGGWKYWKYPEIIQTSWRKSSGYCWKRTSLVSLVCVRSYTADEYLKVEPKRSSLSWPLKIWNDSTFHLVSDRNHYFGLGPIAKPKPKLAGSFSRYRNGSRNHILKWESSYQLYEVFFSIIKPSFLSKIRYFQIIFEDLGLFLSLFTVGI